MGSARVLSAISLTLTLAAGCRSHDKPKGRYDGIDGGYTIREECDMPVLDCYDRCRKRGASVTCIGCCRDQRFLCDMKQTHSFESCDSAP
jgi:hypothetical protein